MPRRAPLVLTLALFLAGTACGQERAAPLYALPADGTWAEYDWRQMRPGQRKLTGSLRLSCVGTAKVKGTACRWVEFKLSSPTKAGARWRKLLLPADAVKQGKGLTGKVVEAYRTGPDGSVKRLGGEALQEFLDLGLGERPTPLRLVRAREEVKTPQGPITCRHLSASGASGQRELEYHVWLSSDTPFGWVKCEVWEKRQGAAARLEFAATLAKTGRDARSELDHTRAR